MAEPIPSTPMPQRPEPQPPSGPAYTEKDLARTAATAAAVTPKDLPDPARVWPEIVIISHSNLMYWWPVWLTGYLMSFLTYLNGVPVQVKDGRQILVNSNPVMGVIFIMVVLLVIIFTNVKMRGIYSLATVLFLAFITVFLAWVGWWDDIFRLIPDLAVHMNVGFYLLFSTALLIIWAVTFFLLDRLRFWRIRPGQMTIERVIGGSEKSYDTRGLLFEQRSSDLFRHIILGLGSGDLHLTTTGAKKETMYIPNVLFANRKVHAIQKVIAIKPDALMQQPG